MEQSLKKEYLSEPIPSEFQQQLSKIMADSPTLIKVGDKEFKIKGLRMYSIERIFQVAQEIEAFKSEEFSTCVANIYQNLEAMSRIVAIILCNHYFDEESCVYTTFDEMLEVKDRNDKLIEMMALKVKLNASSNITEYANIVITALSELNYGELFQLASSVTVYSRLASMRHQRNIEMLDTVQQAGLDKCQSG